MPRSSLQSLFLPVFAAVALPLHAQSVHKRTPGAAASLAGAPPSESALAACQPQWIPTFGGAPGADYEVKALAGFDGGNGPALFAGGMFRVIGGASAEGLAQWDGQHWSEVGGGLSGQSYANVTSLCVFDDGSGPALIAGGSFTSAGGVPASCIAKWDGGGWSALGSGLDSYVRALCAYDDGGGAALYAGGSFVTSGGTVVNRIAKWTGTSWVPLGSGMNGEVFALCTFDDGAGPALYAGGSFTTAGGQPAVWIARWNGSSWSAVGGGAGFGVGIGALCVHDDGSGPALFAGGYFSSIGGTSAANIARWNGAAWSALGSGVGSSGVDALQSYDDGSGLALIAGGSFSSAGGFLAANVARWDGNSWSALGSGRHSTTYALASFDAGSGTELFGGGQGHLGGGFGYGGVDHWNGQQWAGVQAGGLNGNVWALHAFDDGAGEALYAGGGFTTAGGRSALRVARWRGGWSALGDGFDGVVTALRSFDDGGGTQLYAGGPFTASGATGTSHIAVWNGSSWSALASGTNGNVAALAVYDDGSGPALFVGGSFSRAGGLMVNGIAKWQHGQWSTVGGGVTGGAVSALEVYDDGTGPALYAAGAFTLAGGIQAARIARWDGSGWAPLGTGIDGTVRALAVWDDGIGPALCAGGQFTSSGGITTLCVASWRAGAWSALGMGLPFGYVSALAWHQQPSGPTLFMGGWFEAGSGGPGQHIAQWNGTGWIPVGTGMNWNGPVAALALFDDGAGTALCAGGSFYSCVDSGDSYAARWGIEPDCDLPGTILCDPGLSDFSSCPCANPPSGVWRGCDNSAGTGGARLGGSGNAQLSSDTLVLAARDELPTATSVVLQGDASIAGGVTFGQGWRCVGGVLSRLYVKTASGGSIRAPEFGDPSVSAQSAALGDPIAQGTHRYYGVYYRDPTVLGGCPSTSTFNITQQLDVLWLP